MACYAVAMSKTFKLEPARLRWDADEPQSLQFEDIYFCRGSGAEESQYVFLRHNDLPQRWLGRDCFTVAETGFGTGLNFLLTWQCWRETANTDQRLHFLSFEKHPLRKDDLTRALSAWPQLDQFAQELLDSYPPLVRGFHRIHLEQGRVILTLLFGDVHDVLPSLQATVDAWYLDGFDPARNPQMWSESLFRQLAAKTAVGGTFATFTAAGWVRRGLQAAGFIVEKSPGFGHKREMLHGRLPEAIRQNSRTPWFDLPSGRAVGRAVVIGTGFAGAASAHRLAERGWQVDVLEEAASPATKASGNPAGVFYPALTADYSIYGRFYLTAYGHALAEFKRLQRAGIDYGRLGTGVLHLAWSEKLYQRQRAILNALGEDSGLAQWINSEQAAALSGVKLASEGLYYPQAAWMSPVVFCSNLLASQTNIQCHFQTKVARLERNGDSWHLFDPAGESVAEADVVVIAAGVELKNLTPCEWLPMTVARGQLSVAPATAQSRELKYAICHEGYLIPAVDGGHCIGASYAQNDSDLTVREVDQAHNLAMLQRHLPGFHQLLDPTESLHNRVGLRATTPDQLPIIGPIPDREAFLRNYAELHHGRRPECYPTAEYLPGLYLFGGLGSRGLTSALLGAELLACQIGGEPLPMEKELVDAVSPARFLVRDLKRKKS